MHVMRSGILIVLYVHTEPKLQICKFSVSKIFTTDIKSCY